MEIEEENQSEYNKSQIENTHPCFNIENNDNCQQIIEDNKPKLNKITHLSYDFNNQINIDDHINDNLDLKNKFQNTSQTLLNKDSKTLNQSAESLRYYSFNKSIQNSNDIIKFLISQSSNNVSRISDSQNSQSLEWQVNDLKIEEQSEKKENNQLQCINKDQQKAQRMQAHPLTHILVKELNQKDIFYLFGNLIIDFKSGAFFSQEVSPSGKIKSEDIEESRVVSNAIKQIVQIENNLKQGEVSASLQLNVKPLDQFNFIIQLLKNKSNNQVGQEVAKYLELYQNNAALNQKVYIQRAILRAQACNLDFNQLLHKRSEMMKKLQNQIIQENECSQVGFYVSTQYCADYQSFDYPLIALLGFDPGQFSSGISKKGLSMWVSPYTRQLLLLTLLKDWSQNDKTHFSENIDPFYFKTVDDFAISCTAKRERRFIQYEDEMAYIFEGIIDSINLLKIEVDLFTIKRILTLRQDFNLHQKIIQFIDDFEYNVQSSIFLEKYYNDVYQKYLVDTQQIQKYIEKKAKDSRKVCSYRLINQTQQNNIM